jgi:hypothetical protein
MHDARETHAVGYVKTLKGKLGATVDADHDHDPEDQVAPMEEPESPPTPNTLRPHHISLLMVIMLLYRHYPRKRFHPSFLMRVHKVLLEEVVEVRLPIDKRSAGQILLIGDTSEVIS